MTDGTRVCERDECEEVFVVTRPRRRFCSERCRRLVEKRRGYARHRRPRQLVLVKASTPALPRLRRCVDCGVRVPDLRKLCSGCARARNYAAAEAWRRQQWTERAEALPQWHPCEICARPIRRKPRHVGRIARYCSRTCANWASTWRELGIDVAAASAIVQANDGTCDACGDAFVDERGVLDHCHGSLMPRGLIHRSCNFALGHGRDDPVLLRRLADYLDRAAYPGWFLRTMEAVDDGA